MKSYKHCVVIKNFEFEIKPLKSELKILICINEGIEFSIFKYLQKNEILSLNKRFRVQFLLTPKINQYIGFMIKSNHHEIKIIYLKYYRIYKKN